MKALFSIVSLAAALAVPAVSFAQSTSHLTRAQVRADLVEVENAGYRPGDGDNTQYPRNIQQAEGRIAARNAAAASYGTPAGSSSQAGYHASQD
jgi:hypothetical protein